jgi:hypothetical protein
MEAGFDGVVDEAEMDDGGVRISYFVRYFEDAIVVLDFECLHPIA